MTIRFVHLPELAITTGTGVRRRFPRHIHDSFCIGLVERGTRTVHTPAGDVCIAPGELFVLNPQQPHAATDADTCYHVASIRPGVMVAFAGGASGLAVQPVRIADRQLAHAMRRLCALAEHDHDPLERETLLAQLVARLVTHCSACDLPQSPGGTIQQARDYIHAHYARKLNLTELAAVCHLSPYHFQRVFVDQAGVSPHDYLVHVRIQHGKALLRQGMPIADVAQAAGFVDQSHFTRSFKRVVGLTPGYFARQHR